ncbi:unnamed protein product [Oreochromis niloticus]|nr:unnamed protein product [Mustela putorius furo]
MSHKKISVVILGNGKSLKKSLIVQILGKDLSELSKKNILKNIELHENHTYEFICTPDLDTECEYKFLSSKNPPPDMCLVVVEDGFSAEDVWQQIEDLSKKTEKPIDEFTVVLPLRYKPGDYPFKSSTIQQLFSELDQLAAERGLTLSTVRPATDPDSQNQIENMGIYLSYNVFFIKTGKLTSTKVNFVLLGMSGTGKSAFGNTILGKKFFMSKASSKPVTAECQEGETEINGVHVRVIDTPDIFDDDDIKSPDKDKHVKKCKELCESEPCVYLLVMHVSRFTDGERDILTKLEKSFGNKVSEQTVILFTRGDDLQQAEMSLEDFLDSCQPDLKEIIEKCGNRCVVFENSRSDSDQREKLMDTVIRMLDKRQK